MVYLTIFTCQLADSSVAYACEERGIIWGNLCLESQYSQCRFGSSMCHVTVALLAREGFCLVVQHGRRRVHSSSILGCFTHELCGKLDWRFCKNRVVFNYLHTVRCQGWGFLQNLRLALVRKQRKATILRKTNVSLGGQNEIKQADILNKIVYRSLSILFSISRDYIIGSIKKTSLN